MLQETREKSRRETEDTPSEYNTSPDRQTHELPALRPPEEPFPSASTNAGRECLAWSTRRASASETAKQLAFQKKSAQWRGKKWREKWKGCTSRSALNRRRRRCRKNDSIKIASLLKPQNPTKLSRRRQLGAPPKQPDDEDAHEITIAGFPSCIACKYTTRSRRNSAWLQRRLHRYTGEAGGRGGIEARWQHGVVHRGARSCNVCGTHATHARLSVQEIYEMSATGRGRNALFPTVLIEVLRVRLAV